MNFFKKKSSLILGVLVLLFGSATFAAELPSTFLSIKSAGMGGTGVANFDADTILYLNPAWLTSIDGWKLNIGNGTGFLGTDLLAKGKPWIDAFKKSTTNEKIAAIGTLVPTRFDLGLGAYPIGLLNYLTPSYGVGVNANLKVVSAVLNPVIPRFEGYAIADAGANIAYAKNLTDNISIGGNVKYLYRAATYDPSTESNSIKITASDALNKAADYSYYKAGGIAFDLGLLGKFNTFLGKTNLGLALNNISANLTGSRIDKTTSNSVQTSTSTSFKTIVPMVTTVGLAVHPTWKLPLGLLDETTLAVDYKSGIPSDAILRNLHLGYEKRFGRLALRMGLNESYVVGGFGLDLGGLKFDYAYFAEEGGQTLNSVPVVSHVLSGSIAIGGKKVIPIIVKAAKKGEYIVNVLTPVNKSTLIEDYIVLNGFIENSDGIIEIRINGRSVTPFLTQNYFEIYVSPINAGPNLIKVEALVSSPESGIATSEAKILRTAGSIDVQKTNFAFDQINFMNALGLMKGYADGSFKPNNSLTRGELVTLLMKAKGAKTDIEIEIPFKDLKAAHWAAKYAALAAKENIVGGYADGTFKPGKKVTRAEAAAIISKFSGIIGSDSSAPLSSPYLDVLSNHWAIKYVSAAKEAGIFSFITSNIFEPNRSVTRAEIAFMLSKTPLVSKLIDDMLSNQPYLPNVISIGDDVLELSLPPDNAATYFDSILVSGKVINKSVSTITINTQIIASPGAGKTFSKILALNQGENTIDIKALDKNKKELFAVKKIISKY